MRLRGKWIAGSLPNPCWRFTLTYRTQPLAQPRFTAARVVFNLTCWPSAWQFLQTSWPLIEYQQKNGSFWFFFYFSFNRFKFLSYNFLVVVRQNVPITSILADCTLGSWKDFDINLSLIGSKEMIWKTCYDRRINYYLVINNFIATDPSLLLGIWPMIEYCTRKNYLLISSPLMPTLVSNQFF